MLKRNNLRSPCSNKRQLFESIMANIEPVVRQAVNEAAALPMSEKLIRLMTKMKVDVIHFPSKHGGGHISLKDEKLTYEHGLRYYTNKEYAFEIAYEILNGDIEAIKDFRKIHKANKKLSSNVLYINFDRGSRPENMNSYVWKSDIRDSGIIVNPDGSVTGTIDQLRKFQSLASNHGRYTSSTYGYENEELKNLLSTGSKYNLFTPFNSFEEYYHGSIVD